MRKGQVVKMAAGKYAGQAIALAHRWPGTSGEWSGHLVTNGNSAIVRVIDMEHPSLTVPIIPAATAPVVSSAMAVRFQEIFEARLAKYWLGPLRLDIVRFDDEIVKSNENESVAQAIGRRWGYEAVELVKTLL